MSTEAGRLTLQTGTPRVTNISPSAHHDLNKVVQPGTFGLFRHGSFFSRRAWLCGDYEHVVDMHM